MSLSYIT